MEKESNKIKFIDMLAKFYGEYFSNTAKAVELLAEIQKEFKEDYDRIRNFNEDPDAINDIIDKIPEDKQALLLKLLLRAGKFGRSMVNLFDSKEEEKRRLAKELKEFGENIAKESRKTVKGKNESNQNKSD
ncbi:MAG: hypothetical protein KKG60_01110 [Nanoarchaeota archaeon]|nr:hypothetical protein [Nanoarchaeota archaeon]